MTLDFNGTVWGIPAGGFPDIPEAAVEAAVEAHCEGTMRAALEAAALHVLFRERELQAKLDAIRHVIRPANWATGEQPRVVWPIQNILDGKDPYG